MSLSFNDSGLLTRGMGTDHKLVTRGFGKKFEFGGFRRRQTKEYYFDMMLPISKENYQELEVYSALEKGISMDIPIKLNILKEIEEEKRINTQIDHSKLIKILEEV